MVVSPDGRYFAFTAVPSSSANGKSTLWVQPSNSLEARALPNTENARLPFWSPASNALGFFADGHLWITDLSGRNPHSLALAPDGRGGTWNRDGTIVFAPERAGPLSRVASAGGAAKVITALHQGEWGHAWPSFLPDGRHFTYLAHPGSRPHEGHHVFVEALDGSVRRQILAAESGVLHSGDGYLLYQRQRQLLAQPFDLHQFTLTGEPVAVAPDVLQLYPYPSRWQFSVSSHGTLTYRTPQSPAVRLVWRDRTGRSSPLLDTPADISDPALSPNETRVAYSVFEREPSTRHGYGPSDIVSNLYILDRTTGLQSRLVSDPAMESAVVWSPNGKSIVYYSTGGDDSTELLLKDTNDPRAAAVPLATQGFNPAATSWSHDGRFLAYATFERTTKGDVWLLPMSGDRTPIPVLQSRFNEEQGQISPDGRWMAYTSDESGRAEVWVTMLPKATTKWRVSSSGAGDPRWRPDGTELYYITEDRQLMAVPVKRGTIFEFGEAVPLFDTGVPPHWYNARNLYDVARDGRFLFMSPVEDDRSAPVTVVLDWTALLRK
jgi:Tol biopolymer transport system component